MSYTQETLNCRYQPIVEIDSLKILGYEALTVDYLGHLAQAQTDSLKLSLDLCCLAQAVASPPQDPKGALLFLNITPQAFCEHEKTSRILKRFPLKRVVLEVTEAAAFCCEQVAASAGFWRAQNLHGIAIDDVSSGFSRIRLVHDLHPEFIKIDRPLIAACHASARSRVMVSSLCAMARKLGAEVIAEGVEDERQRMALIEAGVIYAQGHLLGDYCLAGNLVSA